VKGTETCDDKNSGGCNSNCIGSRPGFTCINSNSMTTCTSASVAVCGNGKIEGSEKCDFKPAKD
jgi:hypothetical protein